MVPDPSSAACAQRLTTWLLACARGDEKAFRLLHDHTRRRLAAEVSAVLGDRGRSDEALQETYLKVWRLAGSFRPEQGSAMTWLLRVARHAAIDSWRAHHAERRGCGTAEATPLDDSTATLVCPLPSPEQALLLRQQRAALHRGLAALSPALREAAALALLQDQPTQQIAMHCQISHSAARFRVERAVRKLAGLVGESPTRRPQASNRVRVDGMALVG